MITVNVLVVEDETVQAKAIEAALQQQEDWSVEVASSVEEATAAWDGDVDAVVLDHQLPDGTGLDVLAYGQREAPEVPVVYLTGVGDEELALKALSRGAARYVSKGEDVAGELPDLVREVAESFQGVPPVEVVEQGESGGDGPGGEGRRRRRPGPEGGPTPAAAGVDPDEAELEEALAGLVEPPVKGIGVFDDRGDVVGARLPDGVDVEAAGILAAAVAHQFEGLSSVLDLGLEGQYLLGRGEDGVAGLTVVPGPLVVVLLLEPDVSREGATGRLFQVAAQVWEAAT